MKAFVPSRDVAMFQGCSVFVFSHCTALTLEIRFRFFCKAHCSETLTKSHLERKDVVSEKGKSGVLHLFKGISFISPFVFLNNTNNSQLHSKPH